MKNINPKLSYDLSMEMSISLVGSNFNVLALNILVFTIAMMNSTYFLYFLRLKDATGL